MAVNRQKLKLLYLMRLLEEETDAEQGLTMPQILERLEDLGITAERKSIYRDIEALPERVVVEKNVAKRVAKSHKIRTDTGIEITFPAEMLRNTEYVQFVNEPNGLISIELKNIGHIENR